MKQMRQLIPIANTSAFLMLIRCAWFDAYKTGTDIDIIRSCYFLFTEH